jgi:NADPH-dependent 2,4-dienoyl-CoA reductase/sulfur reductase-like enzyme
LTGVTATAIDAAASRVSLDEGRELRYDRLLLTTGAEPRRISIPGADLWRLLPEGSLTVTP